MNTVASKLSFILLVSAVAMQAAVLHKQYAGRPQARSPIGDAPAGTVVDITAMPVIGSDVARAVLIEFTDYQCPFCRRHAMDVLPAIRSKFVDAGKLRYVVANNPRPAIHPRARALAKAAVCATEQNRFWPLHDMLYQVKEGTDDEIAGLAAASQMDEPRFKKCLAEDSDSDRRVESDMADASRLKLRGTPSFAIGIDSGRGRITIKKFVVGAVDVDVFDKVISGML